MIDIGIDTGTHTGFAVWDEEARKFIEISTYGIIEAIYRLDGYISEYGADQIAVYVENANLRKWIPRERSVKERVGRAKGAGVVCAHSNIWISYCEYHHLRCIEIAPKDNATKMSAESFKNLTKWQGRTSEHSRDGAMMVFGLISKKNNSYNGF